MGLGRWARVWGFAGASLVRDSPQTAPGNDFRCSIAHCARKPECTMHVSCAREGAQPVSVAHSAGPWKLSASLPCVLPAGCTQSKARGFLHATWQVECSVHLELLIMGFGLFVTALAMECTTGHSSDITGRSHRAYSSWEGTTWVCEVHGARKHHTRVAAHRRQRSLHTWHVTSPAAAQSSPRVRTREYRSLAGSARVSIAAL